MVRKVLTSSNCNSNLISLKKNQSRLHQLQLPKHQNLLNKNLPKLQNQQLHKLPLLLLLKHLLLVLILSLELLTKLPLINFAIWDSLVKMSSEHYVLLLTTLIEPSNTSQQYSQIQLNNRSNLIREFQMYLK